MKIGDLVKLSNGGIGRIIKIDPDSTSRKIKYFISTFPEDSKRNPFEENIILEEDMILELSEIRLISKDQEVIKYPNNYAYHKYGICTTCQTKRDANVSTDKDEIECESCLPGWVTLFDTELQRDLHAIELKHNVLIVPYSINEHNWKKSKRKKG